MRVTWAAAALQLDDIGHVFRSRGGERTVALGGVSFAVDPGAVVALVGPSGCGKSTLLRIAAGLQIPSDGSVTIGGEPVSGPNPAVGMVFQRPALLPWRTVLENVLLPADVRGRRDQAARREAADLLDLVGLAGFAGHYPAELSGGMQGRVGLARALASEPSVLLMDEPFGALDALGREAMAIELQRVWGGRQPTVMLVTHDVEEAVLLADRVLVMTPRPGRISADLAIDLPRPRTLDLLTSDAFVGQTVAVRAALRGPVGPAAG